MNKDTFFSYLQNPELLSSNDAKELELVLEEFPYFQTAQLLTVKAYFNTNSIHYATKLKTASVYANDRLRLYELLQKNPIPEAPKKQETIISKPIVEETKQIVTEEKIKVETKKETSETTVFVEKEIESVTPILFEKTPEKTVEIEPKIEKEIIYHETILDSNSIIENNTSATFSKLVEEKIHINVASKNEEQESLSSTSIKATPDNYQDKKADEIEIKVSPIIEVLTHEKIQLDNVEKEILAEVVSHHILEEISTKKTELKTEVTTVKPEQEKINLESPHTFSEWLRISKLSKEEQNELLKTVKTINPHESLQKKVAQLNLIERFIEKEPKISTPQKTEFFNAVNKAKESATEDFSFVTETLAKIYHQQGNNSKALKAYEQLSLKFPEKSAYFASQIEKIKQQLKK